MPWGNRPAAVGIALVVLLALLPVTAQADDPAPAPEPPLLCCGSGMQFPAIRSASDPEEYSWTVQLEEGQELRQIDEREVAAYYKGDHLALDFVATEAHDAVGATVPTTLKVVGEKVIALTVRHRDGNPEAGGAPFTYPIVSGAGWKGGFGTYIVSMPPPETAPASTSPDPAPTLTCRVPDLHGATLGAARSRLRRAHCRLGAIARAPRATAASGRVVRQAFAPGKTLEAWGKVGVRLGLDGGGSQ